MEEAKNNFNVSMADCVLEEAEKLCIIDGIRNNLRSDGRGCLDYRAIELETGVVWTCNGSSFIKIGETKLIAGVKAEIKPSKPNHPDTGWIEVSMNSLPHADMDFERSGGRALLCEIDQILTQTCNNDKLLDLKSLCIIPSRLVWALYVDIMILGYDGNLIDAASMATKAALFDTKIEGVTVNYEDDNFPEIEVSGNRCEMKSLDVSNLPLLITFVQVEKLFIVDANADEESCSQCKLVFAISPLETTICKDDGPSNLHIESVQAAIDVSEEVGLKLQKQLMDKLQKQIVDMLEFEKTIEKKRMLS